MSNLASSDLSPPIPPNPFKEARESIVDPATGRSISHSVLAKRMGVTKLSLIRLEQGIFVDPLPTVLKYYLDHGFNYLVLTDGYIDFQHATRLSHCYYFGDNLEVDPSNLDVHPLLQLLTKQTSVMQISKDLCVPQHALSVWLNKPAQQQTVPKCFINVLPILGYTDEQISDFLNEYKDWRCRLLGKNVRQLRGSNG